MKKTLLATLLATFVLGASALELGINASSDRNDADHRDTGAGVTLGTHSGDLSFTGGLDYYGRKDIYKTSAVVGYDVAKFGPVTVTPKIGAAYLNNQTTADGYAMTVGVGASVPVTKQVSVGLDYARQYGQDRVSQFDGNRLTAAVKYSF